MKGKTAEQIHTECVEMMNRTKEMQSENAQLLDLAQKTIRLALGQTVSLEPKGYKGSLQFIADQLANESGELAKELRQRQQVKNKGEVIGTLDSRNCQDVMLEIMQLSMMNKGIIDICAEYSPSNDNFHVHVIAFGSSYKADEVEWLYESRVYFSFDDNPLQKMLEIEDKLLELIADAKDKAEVAA